MKFGVWLIERCLETFGMAVLLILIEAPLRHISDSLIEEILRTTFFPLMFYVISGYLASCIYFGLIARLNNPVLQVGIIAVAFSVHAFVFFLVSSDGFDSEALKMSGIGLSVVVFANSVGSLFLSKRYDSLS